MLGDNFVYQPLTNKFKFLSYQKYKESFLKFFFFLKLPKIMAAFSINTWRFHVVNDTIWGP